MKKIFIMVMLLCCATGFDVVGKSKRGKSKTGALSLGKRAPQFCLAGMIGSQEKQICLKEYLGKYVVLFFYPKDFTFVCPTELQALNEKQHEFERRNAVVFGVSVDSLATHKLWLETPMEKGGIAGISIPLLSDEKKSLSRRYGVFNNLQKQSYRAVFIIDPKGTIAFISVTADGVGRSIDELLRQLDALRIVEEHGVVCPVNWQSGDQAMRPTKEGVVAYFKGKGVSA